MRRNWFIDIQFNEFGGMIKFGIQWTALADKAGMDIDESEMKVGQRF